MSKFSQRFSRVPASGFTLVEIMIVVVIIGLLAGYVGPRYFGQIGKAEVKAARAQLRAQALVPLDVQPVAQLAHG